MYKGRYLWISHFTARGFTCPGLKLSKIAVTFPSSPLLTRTASKSTPFQKHKHQATITQHQFRKTAFSKPKMPSQSSNSNGGYSVTSSGTNSQQYLKSHSHLLLSSIPTRSNLVSN